MADSTETRGTGTDQSSAPSMEGLDGYAGRDQAGHLLLWRQSGKNLECGGYAQPREWIPADEDWKLPENWKEIIMEGLEGAAGQIPVL